MANYDRTPRPSSFSINNLNGSGEMRVHGRSTVLEKKVRTIFAAMPEGSVRIPPRATWQFSFDCDRKTDCFTIRFQVLNAIKANEALSAMTYPQLKRA